MSEDRRAAPMPKTLEPPPAPRRSDSATTEVGSVTSVTPTQSLGEVEALPPRPGMRDSSPGARRRGRTALRIPDDEVARPQGPASDGMPHDLAPQAPAPVVVAPPPPPMAEPAGRLMPMRIISINATETSPKGPPPDLPPSAPLLPPPAAIEDGWTPFQPAVRSDAQADGRGDAGPLRVSDDLIPIDTDPMMAEAEEVRFDDDAPTPSLPPVAPMVRTPPPPDDGERSSDPGAEIALEDVVAVELPQRQPSPQAPRPSLPAGVQRIPASAKAPLVIVPPHTGTPSTEGSALRRKGRLWWEDLFNDDYLRTCEKITDEQIAREVDFIEQSLGIERGGAVLDLACGTGRQAIDLARRGYQVVGFDLSLAMLARAGEEAQDRDTKLNFVQGDMREMSFAEQFDGVFCWSTSFGFFEEEKNALVVERIHRSLRAGGRFLLDVVNRDFLVRQSPSLAWFEGDGCVCMDEMSVDFITSRMKVKRTMMLDDGRSREIEYSMRVYSLHELGKILHDHGFKVCEVSGRLATPGVFFGNESPRTIILAEKR